MGQIWIFLSRLPSHQWRGAVLLQCRPCPTHCDPRPIWIQPCLDLQGTTGVGINVSSMLGQNNCNPQLGGKRAAKHHYINGYHNWQFHAPIFSPTSKHNCHTNRTWITLDFPLNPYVFILTMHVVLHEVKNNLTTLDNKKIKLRHLLSPNVQPAIDLQVFQSCNCGDFFQFLNVVSVFRGKKSIFSSIHFSPILPMYFSN